MMQLAFYKGPAAGVVHQAAHRAVAIWTHGPYSHVELVMSDGTCWSSSMRDGGVRCKRIELNSGRWDLVPIDGDEAAALAWFRAHDGEPYDWLGLLGFVFPWRTEDRRRSFCSEAVCTALRMPFAWQIDPNDLNRIALCARVLRVPQPAPVAR